MEEGESVWITSTIMAGPVVSLAQQGGFPALKGNQALLGRQEPPALKGNQALLGRQEPRTLKGSQALLG